jgi:AcrR family transcriptional regulator
VLDQILKHAARLFAEKGYAGTSLQDVSDSVGLQRTSLYYYFKTKEDLIAAIIEDVTVAAAQRNRSLRNVPGRSALVRVSDMVFDSVIRTLEHPEQFRLLDRIEAELPDTLAATYVQSKRAVRDEMIQAIIEGMRSGEIVQVDPRVAAFALIGMVNWTAWWYQPGKGLDPKEIATIMSRLAANALSRGASTPAESTARGVIEGIRNELDRLEALVAEPKKERKRQ